MISSGPDKIEKKSFDVVKISYTNRFNAKFSIEYLGYNMEGVDRLVNITISSVTGIHIISKRSFF